MRKIFLFGSLLIVSVCRAQFSNGKDFVEFSKLTLEKQKTSLKVNGWKLTSSTTGSKNPNAAFKVTQAVYYTLSSQKGTYALSIKAGSLPAGKMKETKLVLPDQQGLLLSSWISELSKNGYKFSQINAYAMAAVGKTYTITIKMIPSDGYTSPISEITYMAH